jgi:hypothetical protein
MVVLVGCRKGDGIYLRGVDGFTSRYSFAVPALCFTVVE